MKSTIPGRSTPHVQAYRQRQRDKGEGILYVNAIPRRTMRALQSILEHRGCTRREAIESAIQHYADHLSGATSEGL